MAKKNARNRTFTIIFVFLTVTLISFNVPLLFGDISVSTEWIQSSNGLEEWTQMDGDEFYDSSDYYSFDVEYFEGEYTGSGIANQTEWWTPNLIDPMAFVGIYKNEGLGLASDEWEYSMLIDVNNTQQTSGSYTFKGYMYMEIHNENKEIMLQLNIVDNQGSTGLHDSRIEYSYFDVEEIAHLNYTSYRGTTFNIDDELMGIKKNGTGIFWKLPEAWITPSTGQWIYWGSEASLLSRGTPNYLIVKLSRQWRRPTEWSFQNLSFQYSILSTTSTTIEDTTTTTTATESTTSTQTSSEFTTTTSSESADTDESGPQITSGFKWAMIILPILLGIYSTKKLKR